jgi:hypothetical protein
VAADVGLMEIEWNKRGLYKLAAVVKTGGVGVGTPAQRRVDGRSKPRRGLGEDVWMHADTLRRDARERVNSAVCGRVISCRRGQEQWRTELELWAVNRPTTAIGPPHLGQRHSGCAVGAVDVSDWFGGVGWRAAKHRGSMAARLRLARKPKWRMRTKLLGSR